MLLPSALEAGGAGGGGGGRNPNGLTDAAISPVDGPSSRSLYSLCGGLVVLLSRLWWLWLWASL
jgi:hypothetical protein